jgi:two-component system sensor histidine kinase PilS (NtrC family)
MLPRVSGPPADPDTSQPFLPLSFRLFASFGLLVLHLALPAEGRATGPGEGAYILALALMLIEAAWESSRALPSQGRVFPVPSLPWIRWNLILDLALVSLVVGYQGVTQERFSTLYIFPVLASAFYVGTTEIVWVGVFSSATHILLVMGFLSGLLPPFGESGLGPDLDPGSLTFILGLASVQIFAATLVVVLIRRNLESLKTDLSASEAAVDELSALHLRVVESMSSGLITLDLEERITSANPAAESILGQSIAPGRPLRELLPVDSPLPTRRGREQRFELSVVTPDRGRRTLGGHLTSLRGAAGQATGHLLLFQDLTELKALAERTRISERMATVGQLAAGLAHELRNPLASISGCVQLLQTAGPGHDVKERVLGILERETQRVNGIVSDFLDFARPGQGATQILSLPKVLDEARGSWEMDPRTRGIPLSLTPVPDLLFRADPLGVHRILMNLLSNARKAVSDTSSPQVRLEARQEGEQAWILVLDNGCGMSPEQMDRLFVPFAGSFEEGTGLGMSLVYKLTQELGWQLEVESRPGGGTTVHLGLPVFTPSPPVAPEG